MSISFSEYSTNSRTLIKNRLREFCEDKKNEDLPLIFKQQKLIEEIMSFALRGKLIRGTLFLLAAQSMGRQIDDELIDVACCIEFMHSALLIQDDIIDKDYTRRGEKTIFAHYEDEGKKIKAFEPYHYGISTAIVGADVAFFFAIELMSSFNSSNLHKLMRFYAHEVYLVSLAESADSIFGQTDVEPSEEDIESVYKYKTARYTFSMPFEMAAIVSQASEDVRDNYSKLGELSGLIFQLKDDEIGLFGNEKLIGKPVGGDIRENKKTMIRFLLYQNASPEDRKILNSCFGNPQCGAYELQMVKDLYAKYKIGDIIAKRIEEIMKKVWTIFDKLDIETEYKAILKELLEFNLQRSA